ncbi:MAG: HU family DNA-binding protein, partial [Lysobacter sp.]
IAHHHRISRAEAAAIIATLTDVLTAVLHQKGRVKLQRLGRFNVVTRQARLARNPKTGVVIQVPERVGVKFVPAPELLSNVQHSPAVDDL